MESKSVYKNVVGEGYVGLYPLPTNKPQVGVPEEVKVPELENATSVMLVVKLDIQLVAFKLEFPLELAENQAPRPIPDKFDLPKAKC